MPNEAGRPAAPPERLLLNRNFVLLFSGKLVSLLGDQVYLIALSWYVLSATHSPVAAGILLMSGALPFVLIGPFTGVLADRFDRRAILVTMDAARGILLAAVAAALWLHVIPIWLLFICSFLLGTLGAVFNPASSAILPNIVTADQLAPASAVDQFLWSGCTLVGMMAGGILFNLFGIVAVFLINAGSYFVSGSLELCMRLPPVMPGPGLRSDTSTLSMIISPSSRRVSAIFSGTGRSWSFSSALPSATSSSGRRD